MGPVVAIDEIGDERVADYRNLTDAELLRILRTNAMDLFGLGPLPVAGG